MKPSSTNWKQKNMNRTRLAYQAGIRRLLNTVNADLSIKINNHLKICFVIR